MSKFHATDRPVIFDDPRRNWHSEINWQYAFQHAERHCSFVALGKLQSKVAAK